MSSTKITDAPRSGQRFEPYPAYTDSGIEWLGEIPAHWEVKQLRYTTAKIGSGKTPSGGGEVYVSEGVMLLRSQNVHFAGLRLDDVAFIDAVTDAEMAGSRVKEGDVLLNITGASLGRCCVARLNRAPANVNQHVCVIRPRRSTLKSSFLAAVVSSQSVQTQIFNTENGISRDALNFQQIGQLRVTCPTLGEQDAIADFLDRETARIDALVAKKEQLITLLQERRTALISRAVTKGLDPNAPMRDPGVEWLGEIPAHWGVTKLRYGCSLLRDGTHQPPERVAEGYPLLSVRNIVDGKLARLPDDSMISEMNFRVLERSFNIRENDILLAIVGATLGKVAVVPPSEPFAVQRSLAVLRPRRQLLDFQYLASLFQSHPFQRLLWQSVGYSAQPGIYLNALASFRVSVPPIREQAEIVKFVLEVGGIIDELIGRIREAIERLKELRTALISAG